MPPTPNDNEPQTINNIWGSSALGKTVFLTCPSGQTVYAKVIGLEGVVKTGVMGEADSLTAFVGKHFVKQVREGKGAPPTETIDADRLLKSPDMLQKIVKMVDALMPYVIADPVVKCHYAVLNAGTPQEDTIMISLSDRVPGYVYTDQIDLPDKMFLFNFAMSGVADAESFRKESEAALGVVADGPGVPGEAKRSNGSGKRRRPRRR
jgi:hypothetical protein